MATDEIVEELDVYFSKKEELGAQLFVLQHPLRTASNPYDTERAEKIQFKPQSQKLEIEIPEGIKIESGEMEEERKQRTDILKLASTPVDLRSIFYTVGYKRKNGLFLTEIEGVLQLRPDLDYLNPIEDEILDDQPKEELTQLQVKVRKKESAIEQQKRENSYAHIAKKEKLEKWIPLTPIPSVNPIVDRVLEQLVTPVEREVDMSMKKEIFLSNIAPKISKQNPSLLSEQTHSKELPKPIEITKHVLHELSVALEALFSLDGVANLKDIRNWLRIFENGDRIQDLAVLEDDVLHDAILQTENATCIHRVYLRSATGSVQIDPLRSILIEIVRKKEIIKRNDVISAAKAKGIKITERLFDTVMREICVVKDGGYWMLKTGRVG